MAFVNEYIPEADIKKYGIEEIDKRFLRSTFQPDWTIDRERDIYLRQVASGREEFSNQQDYTLYWKGSLVVVRFEERGGGTRGGEGWAHYKLLNLGLSEALNVHRQEIINDLKEALTAYKDFGVYSVTTVHTATFDF